MASLGAPGPFSLFPGIQRIIVPLDGPGFALKQGEATSHWVSRLETLAFSGDATTVMTEVKDSTLDLNVMIDPLWGQCSVNVVQRSGGLEFPDQGPAELYFFVAVDQTVAVTVPELSSQAQVIPPLGALLISGLQLIKASAAVGGGGALIWGVVFRR